VTGLCGEHRQTGTVDPSRIYVGECAVCGLITEVYDNSPRAIPSGYPCRKRWWAVWR